MKNIIFYLCLFRAVPTFAQEAEADAPPPRGWEFGAGIGLDLAQLLQINPKQGAGQNRLGIGGATNFFGKFRQDRQNWDNLASWQFGLQRLGSGVIAQGTDDKIPFQKEIDELRLNSKYGYRTSEESKFYYTVNGTFLSQLTPTYQFPNIYPGNFVTDFPETGRTPLSRFFAPATVTLSAGIDYKPNENFSLFYSPLASKFIIVASDSIAALGVHGNEVSGEAVNGFFPEFENVDAQLGSLAQLQYLNNFWNERATITSSLNLYSNYLRNPQNVDLDWTNTLVYKLTENFQLTLIVNAFYDDDVRVQITDYDAPNGVNGLGNRVSITQQFLISYARTF